MAADYLTTTGPVILFDGECNLCHATVNLVIRNDPARRFRFASLQSDAGQQIATAHGVPAGDLASMLLVEDRRVYRQSTAGLRIARRLRFPWPLLTPLLLIPTWLRDPIYDFVGRRRYRWFGRRELCTISNPQASDRFLL